MLPSTTKKGCVLLFRRKDSPQDDAKTRGAHRRPTTDSSVIHIVLQCLFKAAHVAYALCFLMGALVIRLLHRAFRAVRRTLSPVWALFVKWWQRLKKRMIKRWKKEKRLCEEDRLFLATYMPKVWEQKDTLSSLRMLLKVPLFSLYRHRKTVTQCATLLLPLLAAFILYGTVNYWSDVTFGLAVEYQGQEMGYISDETIFASGADMASDRIISTGESKFQVQRTPRLTLAVVKKDAFLSENEICDKILKTSGDEIAEMSGLYVNGNFEGALESRDELDTVLQDILDGYLKENPVTNTYEGAKVISQKAEFIQNVEVLDGLYPVASVMSAADMKNKLTANSVVNKFYTVVAGDSLSRIARNHNMTLKELYAMNEGLTESVYIGDQIRVQRAQPYLRVQVVQKIQYTETIPYETEEQKDSSRYSGYRKVKRSGENGKQRITAELSIVDGLEETHTVLETKVTKKPVNQLVIVGNKKSTPNGPTTASGNFRWPVPSSHLIYSRYGYRNGKLHKGIDIAGHNIRGKAIVAADGGKVIQTNKTDGSGYWSYGNYVLIDHGNGFVTMYAHCKDVYVRTGDRVSKGQTIATVGSTGRSTGNHLHFEIRYRGRYVNPTKYVR